MTTREQVWWEAYKLWSGMRLPDGVSHFELADTILAEFDKRFAKQPKTALQCDKCSGPLQIVFNNGSGSIFCPNCSDF